MADPEASQRDIDYRVDQLPRRLGSQFDLGRLRSRCWWVAFGCAVTGAMFASVGVIQLALLRASARPSTSDWQSWLVGDEFFAMASAASLATTLIWLAWLFRAAANLKAISAPAMTWSPRAAVIWELIPVVNLVMGFFILRAVWQGSFSRPDSAPLLVCAWAISAIAPLAISVIPAVAAGDLGAFDLRAEAAANLLQALACALQAALTMQVTRAQVTLRDTAKIFA
jgi:hypothetical protein